MHACHVVVLTLLFLGPALAGPPAERAHPGRPVSKHLSLAAAVVQAGTPIRLGWFDTPGNAQDWVTVVSVGSPDTDFGPWMYTGGKPEGIFEIDDLGAGDYEARLYLDWPAGDFEVVDRLRFTVVPNAEPITQPAKATAMLALKKEVFDARRPVEVGWHDSPGRAGDWITVVPKGTPPEKWGPWRFTGRKAGTFRVGHLEPGQYEARLYFDWPAGGFEIRDRISFSVR